MNKFVLRLENELRAALVVELYKFADSCRDHKVPIIETWVSLLHTLTSLLVTIATAIGFDREQLLEGVGEAWDHHQLSAKRTRDIGETLQ